MIAWRCSSRYNKCLQGADFFTLSIFRYSSDLIVLPVRTLAVHRIIEASMLSVHQSGRRSSFAIDGDMGLWHTYLSVLAFQKPSPSVLFVVSVRACFNVQ